LVRQGDARRSRRQHSELRQRHRDHEGARRLDLFSAVSLSRRRQPPRRTRQQLPAILLLPDLEDADLGVGHLALELAFRHPQMTNHGDIADGLDREVGKLERLEGGLSRHHPVDEFGLVLETGVRMAVAQLLGGQRLELRFVLFEPRGAQLVDDFFDRHLIGRLSLRRSAKGGCAEREPAPAGQLTTRQFYSFLLLIGIHASELVTPGEWVSYSGGVGASRAVVVLARIATRVQRLLERRGLDSGEAVRADRKMPVLGRPLTRNALPARTSGRLLPPARRYSCSFTG